jgi:hypothetical protein
MEALIRKNCMTLGMLALLAAPLVSCVSAEPGDAPEPGNLVAFDEVAEPGESQVGSATQALELDPSEVFILEIENAGNGCPAPEDTATTIAEDRKSFIVAFNRLGLRIAPIP